MDEQLRLIDLIPRRLSALGVLAVAALAVVAGLVALHVWMFDRLAADDRLAAFDLASERNLATWYSSLVLQAASLAAVLVYTVRRHRTDDYRGHYRIWLWAAMCWLLLSADRAAGLHEGLQQLMIRLTGAKLWGDGAIWWIAPCCFLLGAIGSRLLLDMRRCWLSSTALLLAGGCYGLPLAARAGWVLGDAVPRAGLIKAAAAMTGDVLVLLAMGLHGRHVIRDAKGLVPRRKSKRSVPVDEPDDVDDPQQAADDDEQAEIDGPHGIPQPVMARGTSSPTTSAAANSPADASGVSRKLTKAERRALRDRLEQQRLKRQSQQGSRWGK